MSRFRQEIIGECRLILGDCREVLADMPPCFTVDSVITDPPYGIAFKGKATKDATRLDTYGGYSDTVENFDSIVIPALQAAMARANCSAVMIGNKAVHRLLPPDDIGGIYAPAGGGLTSWGFTCLHLVLLYGRSPYLAAGKGSRPTATQISHPGGHITGERDIEHPCPKPVSYMNWTVNVASLPGQVVLDPFMGSGTTGVACVNLGRRFIGIELHEPYFDIACRRIEAAYKQPRLFAEPAPKPVQPSIFDGAA